MRASESLRYESLYDISPKLNWFTSFVNPCGDVEYVQHGGDVDEERVLCEVFPRTDSTQGNVVLSASKLP